MLAEYIKKNHTNLPLPPPSSIRGAMAHPGPPKYGPGYNPAQIEDYV